MSRLTVAGANLPPPERPGAQPVTPPRLNIADLVKNDKQWALYIQALTIFQHEDPAKPLSWFAVSGIHGFPSDLQWENGGPKTEGGYCVHGRPHFPTWHRPYIALYEQALQAAALSVAQRYKTDTDAWVRAALTLRSPYWDWAHPATYLPPRQVYDTVRFANLRITTPDGPKDVPNPLLSYAFQRRINWRLSQSATIRHPLSPPNPAASIAAFEEDVGSQARLGNLQWDCWRTLNWTTTWLQFSNGGATQGQRANSLETLHDRMHTRTGGRDGHMSNPISAAFDPLFMLHHTNVDRQLALWQTLHPEVWISQQNEPNFANRDLTPFWKGANAFHRSTDAPVRDFVKFRATYPEFVGLEGLSAAQRKERIQARVDELYDPNNRRRGVPVRAAAAVAGASAPVAAQAAAAPPPQAVLQAASAPRAAVSAQATPAALSVRPAPIPAPVNPDSLSGLQRLDWFIRVRVKKFQLGQSFTVLFFAGPAPTDAAHYRSSPNLIGSHSEFVNSDPEHCANCRASADLITEGFIDLDDALERLGHGEKTEEEIEKYLHDNLHWRIQRIDGTLVPVQDLDVIEVSVMSWDLLEGDINVRPVHRDVTSHKPGGRVPGQRPYNI